MNKSNDIYRSRINKVIDYVSNHLDKTISLEELAAVAFFSPFHFHRIFVAVTGETVNSFTNRVRNEKVARLLRFSAMPVSEIAVLCGFSSPSTLSRLFKQYFGISPTGYRNGAAIENSKIRKALFQHNTYHCSMTAAELAHAFPVAIKQLPERRVAYIRVTDAFREGVVIKAFADLAAWAKQMHLFEAEVIFGMSMDDPDVTPKEKYRYEACITLPAGFEVAAGSPVETMVLPRCRYAVTTVSGDMNLVTAATNYLFDNWLINSSYECEPQYALEVFLDKTHICNWAHLDLELYIPVKPLKNV